jgi:integrase/recombinase XerC
MLVALSNWQNPTKRRLEAIRAAHERDEAGLLELLEVYLTLKGRKRATVSPRTLEAYKVGVRDYLAWAWPVGSPAPKVALLKATSDELDIWITQLQTQGSHIVVGKPLKPASIATYLSGVRTLYRALQWAGAATLPAVHAPQDPTPREERRPALPKALYKKLLEYLSEQELYRDLVLVRLMGEAGLRISEALGLKIADVHLDERLLEVVGKGNKRRSVPVSKSLAQALADWLKLRTAQARSDYVIINLGPKNQGGPLSPQHARLVLNKHYQTLDFPTRYSGAHMLRHTAGTRFYKVSKDLHATARILGHSNINTSAIYAKMDLEGLFELVDSPE